MKTWNDYKSHVRSVDPDAAELISESEELAAVVSALISQRKALGMSQRELAAACGLPQSSVARIESMQTLPRLDTLVKLSQPLGLQVKLIPAAP